MLPNKNLFLIFKSYFITRITRKLLTHTHTALNTTQVVISHLSPLVFPYFFFQFTICHWHEWFTSYLCDLCNSMLQFCIQQKGVLLHEQILTLPPSLYSCIITWLVNILRTVWQISRKDDIPERLNYVGGSSIPIPYT